MEELLTVEQAASLLGMHPKTIRDWSNRKGLPHTRNYKGWRLYKAEDLIEFAKKRGLLRK